MNEYWIENIGTKTHRKKKRSVFATARCATPVYVKTSKSTIVQRLTNYNSIGKWKLNNYRFARRKSNLLPVQQQAATDLERRFGKAVTS